MNIYNNNIKLIITLEIFPTLLHSSVYKPSKQIFAIFLNFQQLNNYWQSSETS